MGKSSLLARFWEDNWWEASSAAESLAQQGPGGEELGWGLRLLFSRKPALLLWLPWLNLCETRIVSGHPNGNQLVGASRSVEGVLFPPHSITMG